MTSRWKTFTGFSRHLLQLTILHIICHRTVHGLCSSMVPGPAQQIDSQNQLAPAAIGVTSNAACQQWCLSSSACVAVEYDQVNNLCLYYTSKNGYLSSITNQFARYEKQLFTCPTTVGTTRPVTSTAQPTTEGATSTVQETTPQTTAQTTGITVLQSTDRTIFQSTDRTTFQSTDRTTFQPTDTTTLQSTDRTTFQSTDRTTLQSTDRITLKSTDLATLQSTGATKQSTQSDKTTLESTDKATLQSTYKTTLQSTYKTTLQSTDKTTLQSTYKTTLQSTYKTTLQSTYKTTLQSTDKTTLQSTDKTTLQSTDKTLQSTDKTTLQSTDSMTLQSTDKTTLQSADKTTLQSADKTTLQSTDKTTLQSTEKTTLQSTDKTTLQSADKTTLQSADKTTLQSTDKTTLQSADKTTLQSTDKTKLQSTDAITSIVTSLRTPDVTTLAASSGRWVSTSSNASRQPSVSSTASVTSSQSSTTPFYVYTPPKPKPLEAPGAAAFGAMAIIFIVAELSFLVILDIPHLSRDCLRGVRNVRRGLGRLRRCRNKGQSKEMKVKEVNQSTMELLHLDDKPLSTHQASIDRQVPPAAVVVTKHLSTQQSPNTRSTTNTPSSSQRIILLLRSNTQVTETISLKEENVESSTPKSGRKNRSRSIAIPKTQIAENTTSGLCVKNPVASNRLSTASPIMNSSRTPSPARRITVSPVIFEATKTVPRKKKRTKSAAVKFQSVNIFSKSNESPKTQMAETTSGLSVASNGLSTASSRTPSPARRIRVSPVVLEATTTVPRKKKITKSAAVKLQNVNLLGKSNQPVSDIIQSSKL